MFIRRTVIAAALIAVPLSFAASAQATPCSYFGDDPKGPDNSICGVPDLAGTFGNVQTNLQKNFSPDVAAGHLQDNFNPGNAAEHLKQALTHGVGTDDPAE
jgi:hypothetical protein